MQTYDTFRGEGVVDGWAASMAAEHAPSDVVDGWAARMTAEHADPAQQPAADRIEPTFEERVQERVDQFEPQGTDTAGSGGMGDLGEGRRAHEVLGGPDPDHPEVLHTTPGDTEHVADIPPESMEAAIDAGQRDA